MVRHIILWKLKEELQGEELEKVKDGIRENLEGLNGVIPGLLWIMVRKTGLPSSKNADLMLDSAFESPEALKGYAVHPAHVAVAETYVRPFTAYRSCFDYEV
ncbi:MAG: Dabb family protein [Lachnospiraceae bacterium]|nr:Dabb family protein [Lachnospiraceae bacterium]